MMRIFVCGLILMTGWGCAPDQPADPSHETPNAEIIAEQVTVHVGNASGDIDASGDRMAFSATGEWTLDGAVTVRLATPLRAELKSDRLKLDPKGNLRLEGGVVARFPVQLPSEENP